SPPPAVAVSAMARSVYTARFRRAREPSGQLSPISNRSTRPSIQILLRVRFLSRARRTGE
ncbi:MAG TPA: hypothetical protein VJ419_02645, partial [Gaiellaceae bacterium]|nr:hypothetical protein [Gaiellaceae bacterium]